MPRLLLWLLALALGGCTSGTTDSGPSPSASPSAALAENSLVVAVTRENQPGVWLYRLDASRHASLAAQIEPPPGHRASGSLTMSRGSAPDVCALWHRHPPVSDAGGAEVAYCYPAADPERGGAVATGSLGVIALDPAARWIFWTTVGEHEAVEQGTVGAYRSGQVHALSTSPIDCSTYVVGAVWAANERLVLHCTSGDNDDPGFLALQRLGDSPEPAHQFDDYNGFVDPGGVVGESVLVRQVEVCDPSCTERVAPRALRVDLRSAKVLEVIATPSEGRLVDAVSGGQHGIVYVTDAYGQRRDRRVYVRWPGEKHGKPITGLPSDVDRVVAQP